MFGKEKRIGPFERVGSGRGVAQAEAQGWKVSTSEVGVGEQGPDL